MLSSKCIQLDDEILYNRSQPQQNANTLIIYLHAKNLTTRPLVWWTVKILLLFYIKGFQSQSQSALGSSSDEV